MPSSRGYRRACTYTVHTSGSQLSVDCTSSKLRAAITRLTMQHLNNRGSCLAIRESIDRLIAVAIRASKKMSSNLTGCNNSVITKQFRTVTLNEIAKYTLCTSPASAKLRFYRNLAAELDSTRLEI